MHSFRRLRHVWQHGKQGPEDHDNGLHRLSTSQHRPDLEKLFHDVEVGFWTKISENRLSDFDVISLLRRLSSFIWILEFHLRCKYFNCHWR